MLRGKLKKRLLGWAVIEKAQKKQCARINYLREGDTNTKFFHLRANACRRKNFIQRLNKGTGWAVTHEEKSQIIQDHFSATMARPRIHTKTFYWESLQLLAVDLSELDQPLTEEEIKRGISQIPQDRAPGPDGYTGLFYKVC